MGGAAGHLNHPHDRRDLTFKDLKEIINRGIKGTLDKEGLLNEKVDGLNLQITYKDGQIKAARNKSTIAQPLTAKELKLKFKDRDEIEDAFSLAIDDLVSAFGSLPRPFLNDFFKNGSRFLNLEILYPPIYNIIPYGKEPCIEFLNLTEYDNGQAVNVVYDIVQKLGEVLKKNNKVNQKTFILTPVNKIKLSPPENADKLEAELLNDLKKLQDEYKLKDSDTLLDYHVNWWEDYIKDNFPKISEQAAALLLNRWAKEDKSQRLLDKFFDTDEDFQSAKIVDKEQQKILAKENEDKFEQIFLKLGTEVLKTGQNYLSTVTASEFQNEIGNRITELVKKLKEKEEKAHALHNLQKVKTLGGLPNLIPTEGVVFLYKGDLYKLTGLFSPLNKLLGFFRYMS